VSILGCIATLERCGLYATEYTDGVAWSVGRSVYHDREPCKYG